LSWLVLCSGVAKAYGFNTVIEDINISLARGENLAVTGPSGCGKTTLLKIMGLLDKPTKGKIFIRENDTSTMNEGDLAKMRRLYIGYSFQEPTFIPTLNVLENVLLPIYPWKTWGEIKVYEKKAIELLGLLGLSGLKKRRPGDLSTGQRKRVDLARAIIKEPEILIVDEPTANLDENSAEIIAETLKACIDSGGTLIFAAQKDSELLKLAQKQIDLT
jgi:ABC-type lipoprotein export system ATPase subunit